MKETSTDEKNVAWVDEIVLAFQALGGAARYVDLYEYIERTTDRELSKQWKATVRRTIEDHSSDSENFRSSDIFRHLAHGFWGLRNTEIDQAKIEERIARTPKSFVDEVLSKESGQDKTRLVFVREHWRRWPSKTNSEFSINLDRSVFEVVDGWTTDTTFELRLSKGLILRVPFDWHPKLDAASAIERRSAEFGEFGVFWPMLDLVVLVPEILTPASTEVQRSNEDSSK